MTSNETTSPSQAYNKAFQVLFVVVLVAAISGYFVGLRQTSVDAERDASQQLATTSPGELGDAPKAVGYQATRIADLGPNAKWQSNLEDLKQPAVEPPPIDPPDEQQRAEALADRSARRAFAGAPPTVPHTIDQLDTASCLACHETGLAVGKRRAPKMCHELLSACNQCHIAESAVPTGLAESLEPAFDPSQFIGAIAKPIGKRAYPGAPPVTPHPTWMREDCMSCHGPAGSRPLQTTHPERQSCEQCHTAEAALEQFPFAAGI